MTGDRTESEPVPVLSIVIPVYNEVQTIGRILDALPHAMPKRSAAEMIAADARSGKTAVEIGRRFDAMRADTGTFAVSVHVSPFP